MPRPKASENIPAEVLTEAYDAVELGEKVKHVWRRLLEPYGMGESTWRQYVDRHRRERKARIVREEITRCGDLGREIAGDRELTADQAIVLGKVVTAAMLEDASSADVKNFRQAVKDLAALKLARQADQRAAQKHTAEMQRLDLLVQTLRDTVLKGESEELDVAKVRALFREAYGVQS